MKTKINLLSRSGLIGITILLFLTPAMAAKKCKCDEEAVANRETKNADWNKYIHEAVK